MKKISLLFVLMVCYMISKAQIPQGINYQGVAREASGTPIASKTIGLRLSILQGGPSGNIEYAERHTPTTNQFGLYTLVIGRGSVLSGNFAFISWAAGNKWLQVEMDIEGGTSYQLAGSQQLMSVPYALYSQFSGNTFAAGPGISIQNNTITNTGDGDSNSTNELITSISFDTDKKLRITDAGGTKVADLNSLVGSGQNLQQVLAMGSDAGTSKISNIGVPVAASDAATKAYVDAHADADSNPLNEIQNLGSSATGTQRTLTITGGTSTTIEIADNDNDPVNEIQNLSSSITGTQRTINISGGTSTTIDVADNDNSTTNEIQNISKAGSTISLSSGGGSVTLNDDSNTNEIQTISKTGPTISLSSGGGSVTLNDDSNTNEIQNLGNSVLGTQRTITISGGGTSTTIDVADNDNDPINEIQNLSSSITGTQRTINISGGTGTMIDVADNDNNSTNEVQTISKIGGIVSLSLGGGSVILNDDSNTNEIQTISKTGPTISLSSGGGSVTLNDDSNTNEIQNLSSSVSGTQRTINISGGTGTTIDVADNDNNATNEIQTLTYTAATNNLAISSGNNVTITHTLAQVLAIGNDAGGLQIKNVGAPTASTDATTRGYVDNAIANAVATNYAFKVNYSFTNSGGTFNNQLLALLEDFDDFSVVASNRFTALASGTYVFYVDGVSSASVISVKVRVNGTTLYPVKRYPVFNSSIAANDTSTVMLKLNVGDFVELVVDSNATGDTTAGVFFGNKL